MGFLLTDLFKKDFALEGENHDSNIGICFDSQWRSDTRVGKVNLQYSAHCATKDPAHLTKPDAPKKQKDNTQLNLTPGKNKKGKLKTNQVPALVQKGHARVNPDATFVKLCAGKKKKGHGFVEVCAGLCEVGAG